MCASHLKVRFIVESPATLAGRSRLFGKALGSSLNPNAAQSGAQVNKPTINRSTVRPGFSGRGLFRGAAGRGFGSSLSQSSVYYINLNYVQRISRLCISCTNWCLVGLSLQTIFLAAFLCGLGQIRLPK